MQSNWPFVLLYVLVAYNVLKVYMYPCCIFNLQAVRSTHGLEVPLTHEGRLLVEHEYIHFLTQIANQKMEENLRRIHRSVWLFAFQWLVKLIMAGSRYTNMKSSLILYIRTPCECKPSCLELWSVFVWSSAGSTRISSQPCLQRNSKNYKSQILPSHRNYKIILRDWGQKRGKQKKRRRTKPVCINGGGRENSTIRLTVAMVMGPAVC